MIAAATCAIIDRVGWNWALHFRCQAADNVMVWTTPARHLAQ